MRLPKRLAMDWSGCPIVVSRPGYISGAPALRDDPRMPDDLVVENMDPGESAQAVVDNYRLRTSPADVLAVYQYAKQQPAFGLVRIASSNLFSNDYIHIVTVINLLALVEHRGGNLSCERDTCAPQLDTQVLLIDSFKLHLDCESDDPFGQ
jgi:uncharacterized protein (DUF433 family)